MARPKKKDNLKPSSIKGNSKKDDTEKSSRKTVKKTEQLNTSEKVEKKHETEPITNIESEIKNEFEEQVDLTSIEPETEVIEEKDSNVKEELNSIQIDEKSVVPFDLDKIFELKLGTELLDGHLKIQTEGTKIQRKNEEIYHVFGQVQQGAPFDVTFECIDREEADLLWVQLLDYERTPEKYIKEVPKTEQPPVTEQPITEQQPIQPITTVDEAIKNQVDTKPIEPEKKPEDFTGVPLNTVDMDSLINSLPETKSQTPVTNANPVQHLATATNISHLISNQNTAQMEAYGESIATHINTSFQANLWGAMPLDVAKDFTKTCAADYTYEFKNDGKGYYMELTKDKTTVRIPKNPDEYLKVS